MSWTRKLLPRSLRSRLILSFGVLIFLSLFLAGTTTVYLLRQQQEQTARERVGRLAEPIGLRAAALEASTAPNADPDAIQKTLTEEYDVRILLVDRRDMTVASDSGGKLAGTEIANLQRDEGQRPAPGRRRFDFTPFKTHDDELLLFSAPLIGFRLPGVGGFVPRYQTVIAVPESDVSQAWRAMLPRLFAAGGIAFAVGVLAASLLARSITRPLREITQASEQMARGQYDQQIKPLGGDEVGRLAQAFNHMASQVSHSHRTLRDFLANVSHELKTPLTSIQGFSQAMHDGSLQRPEDYAEAGRIINDEAVRMRGLVDDLLYLSQVEAGQLVLHLDRMSPNELLVATRDRFRRRAQNSSVVLAAETNRTPEIRADGRRLEQALANIVENAVRHTPEGGRVTLRSFAENGHVQLSVHNTGSVIPPDAIPRIFDRFFQADKAGARSEGNTGLGLAITKEIVEAHGGTIAVESSDAYGTEFVITLPVEGRPKDALTQLS